LRVLLVEDERRISAYVKRGLEEEGHAVDAVYTGGEALNWAGPGIYDLIILDILLPEMDGISVCRELRKRGDWTSVLMLTARDTVDDRVEGLDAGADDYLVKPFAMKELLARLRAIQRRSSEQAKTLVFQVADLSMDTRAHTVQRGGKRIELAIKEYAVLECLLREPGHVLTRTTIAEHVWNYDTFNQSNVVDVYVRNLRRKIDDPYDRKLIHTMRGAGYSISDDDGTN
jgi:DNA-binding response OmpR family regulator